MELEDKTELFMSAAAREEDNVGSKESVTWSSLHSSLAARTRVPNQLTWSLSVLKSEECFQNRLSVSINPVMSDVQVFGSQVLSFGFSQDSVAPGFWFRIFSFYILVYDLVFLVWGHY